MQIVTIDFETYYDKDYSLSKMTTEAYIRDPRFEVIGVGVKVDDGPTDWYSGDNVGRFLKSLDYRDKAILCHNTAFDGAILAWHYGINPKFWLDTMSMARPLHNITVGGSLAKLAAFYQLGEKGTEVVQALGKRRADFTSQELAQYGKYCCNDADLTYELWKKMKVGFPSKELICIDLTLRMFTEPMIVLDKERLTQHLEFVQEQKADLINEIVGEYGDNVEELLSSNQKFAALLASVGVSAPTKISKTTGKPTYAFAKTDAAMERLLEHPDPRVQTLVAARLGVKSTIEETRTEGMLAVADRGTLPIMLNYYKAHTGRMSGGDKLNLQNLPARENNSIRSALCAPPGYKLIAADSSQIEARVLAYMAGQADLVQAFRDKRDVYSEFASKVYGRTITKADKIERFVGKTCILGLGYGMGKERFQRTLEIGAGGVSVKLDLHEAERIVRLYRDENPMVVRFWNMCDGMLNSMTQGNSGTMHKLLNHSPTGILLPSGFRLQYPLLNRTATEFRYAGDQRAYMDAIRTRMSGQQVDTKWTKLYGGKVTENIVQAIAAYIIRLQMVQAKLAGLKVVFQVHDEIVIAASESQADLYEAKLVKIMSTPPDFMPDLPIACESGQGYTYGEV